MENYTAVVLELFCGLRKMQSNIRYSAEKRCSVRGIANEVLDILAITCILSLIVNNIYTDIDE